MTAPLTLHSPVSGDYSWTVSETGPDHRGPNEPNSVSETNHVWEFGLSNEAHDGEAVVPPVMAPPVLAVADGTVMSVDLVDGLQTSDVPSVVVTIEHVVDGRVFQSSYVFQPHGAIEVRVGDHVEAGDAIAWIGGTSDGGGLRVAIGDALDSNSFSNDDFLSDAEHTYTSGFLGDGSGLSSSNSSAELPQNSQADPAGAYSGKAQPVAHMVSNEFEIPAFNVRKVEYLGEAGTVRGEFGDTAATSTDSELVTPVAIETSDELPAGGTPVLEAPVGDLPAVEAPVVVAPVEEAPVVVAPVEEAPIVVAPVEEAPVVVAPVEEAPIVVAPDVVAPVVVAPEPVTVSTSSSSSSGLLDDAGNNSVIESLVKKFLDGEIAADALQSFVVDGSDQTNVVRVSSNQELIDALKSASGGETILLESGNFGTLELNDGRDAFVKYSSEVTIKSADPNSLAVFDAISLRGVENLKFDSVKFDYKFSAGDPEFESPVRINADSSNISITNSVFDGDVAQGVNSKVDGFGTGNGLFVANSDNISITNNEFFEWKRAGIFDNIDDLLVSGNDVHSIRSDGFNFAEVNRVIVEKNHLHDFVEAPLSGDHKDMIQFWTTGTSSPSTDIDIRENILNSGAGTFTQAIFIRNQVVDLGQAGSDMFYQNIAIENNVIHNASSHGITVGETDGLTIRNNTLLHNRASGDDGPISVPSIAVKSASVNVSVVNNITPDARTVENPNWTIGNNLVVQLDDPDGENYVGDLFVNALAASGATSDDLRAVKGGLVEARGVGANLTRFDDTPDTSAGFVINEEGVNLGLLTHSFDASNIYGPTGKLDLSGAQIEWNFGDGNFGQGVNAVHEFAKAGSYDVEVLVTLPTGSQATLRKTIEVQTPVAIKADFDNGPADQSDLANTAVAGSAVTFEQGRDGDAVRLNNDTIKYEKSDELRNNSEFSILFDFKKDADHESDGGTAVYYSSSFSVNVKADGLAVTLLTNQGTEVLNVNNLGIEDSQWHRVAFTFSGIDGEAVLYVDGVEAGKLTGLTDAVQVGSAVQDFYVGNPFGGSFSGLIDNVGFLRGAIDAADSNAGFSKLDSQTSQDTSGVNSSVDQSFVTNSLPIVGTEDSDTLNGTIWKDDIRGNEGNDILSGRDGNDFLSGGDGNDLLIGGDGNDNLIGGKGDDILAGLKGTDTVQGGGGADVFVLTDTASVDQLTDYIEVDGDVVDLAQLFEIDASGGTQTDNIDDFVRLELDSDSGKTNLLVDQDGGLSNDTFTTVAVVNTTAAIRVNYDDDGTESSALLWL